jgi:hypothetical protein
VSSTPFLWDGNAPRTPLVQAISALIDQLPPTAAVSADEPTPARQQGLSKLIDRTAYNVDFASLTLSDQANPKSEMLHDASRCLEATPSKVLKLAWGPEAFVMHLKRRSGVDV